MTLSHPYLFTSAHLDAGNILVFSRINELSHEWKNGLNEVVIRYVITGGETYFINKKTFDLRANCSLLVNPAQSHNVTIPYQKIPAQGLCFTINKKMLTDVLVNNSFSENYLLDNPLINDNEEFDFFQGIYGQDNILNQFLLSVSKNIDTDSGVISLPPENLFYTLAHRLLVSQKMIKKQVSQINASKCSTRKELYKRVHEARQILDDESDQPLSISEIALEVGLSEFHFFRIFNQAFGTSPHQYRLTKRLENAKEKLSSKPVSISNLALESGFADVQSFSKAFKKAFGVAPVMFQKKLNS